MTLVVLLGLEVTTSSPYTTTRHYHKTHNEGNTMNIDTTSDERPGIANSCNGAHLAGYTKELMALSSNGQYDLHIMVKPDADLDGTFKAFCTAEMEYVRINGWNWTFEDVE